MEVTDSCRIEVENLRFTYKGSESCVLDNISFNVALGEKIALLAPNATGKTTLFNIITGILNYFDGSVKIGGVSVNDMTFKDRARKIAIVPQKHEPLFPFTVRDFIMMGRYPHQNIFGSRTSEDIEIIEKAATLTGADRFYDRPYNTLSGGEMQLAVIARSLAQEPQILILDEPDSHLDFKNRFAIFDLIRRISDSKNMTLIMSLHDPNAVLRFADRVLAMDNGKIVADGKPSEVITPDLLKTVYGVTVQEYRNERGEKLYLPEALAAQN
ncbi:MAG: ABC transporter ATP-binding protein [Candidatus Riflebacteria bacterium]|nr:ABC transporter ATP-binding protein [Candidatus Riflebacteria bacterium]